MYVCVCVCGGGGGGGGACVRVRACTRVHKHCLVKVHMHYLECTGVT